MKDRITWPLFGTAALLGAVLTSALTTGAVAPTATGLVPAASAEANAKPKTTVVSNQEFHAYAKAGETVTFNVSVAGLATDGKKIARYTVRLQGMGGLDRSCTIAIGAKVGTSCNLGPFRSPSAGLWRASIASNLADIEGNPSISGSHPSLNWALQVKSGSTVMSGRVYAPQRYSIYNRVGSSAAQIKAGADDVRLWYLDDRGWLYQATYKNYNGIYSRLRATSLGVTATKSGLPVYASTTNQNPASYRINDPKNVYYKIFFARPDASMPATSPSWDGRARTLNRSAAPLLPSLTGMKFTSSSATTHAGTFSWNVANYTGPVKLTIDTDLSGTVTAGDKTITVTTTGGAVSATWDGKNAAGAVVDPGTAVKAWASIDRTGEIHFTNSDVEYRTGISVLRLNGPAAGRSTLYWNDTALKTDNTHTASTSRPDGRAGFDSTNGVHNLPTGGSSGATGWGNTRWIDDWMKIPMSAQVIGLAPEIIPPTDVRILKTRVGTGPVATGDTVTWKVQVDNAGPSTATKVEVKDLLPDQIDPASATLSDPSQGTVAGMTWSVGTLEKGESATVTVSGKVKDDATGQLVNLATVTSPQDATVPPTTPAECQDNTTLPGDTDNCDLVTVPMAPADVRILKTRVGAGPVAAGDTVTWKVQVDNAGPSTATKVEVKDLLPDQIDPASATLSDPSQGTVSGMTWSVGTLEKGESATVTVSGKVKDGAKGQLVNLATVTSPQDATVPPTTAAECQDNATLPGDSDNCDLVTVPIAAPALQIDKQAQGQPDVQVGGKVATVTWRVDVRNAGAATATQITVDDLLPDGVIAGTVHATSSVGSFDARLSTWSVGTLAPGEQQHLVISADFGVDKLVHGVLNTATVDSPDDHYTGNPDDCQTNGSLAQDDDQCDNVPVKLREPTPPAPPHSLLPSTGGPELWAGVLGLALAALGAGIILVGRRRTVAVER